MSLFANYRGDVRHIVGEIKGPDNTGHGFVRAADADYSPDLDRTLVRFQPIIAPAEVAEVLTTAAGSQHLPTITTALDHVARTAP